jgi:hypothetical protein
MGVCTGEILYAAAYGGLFDRVFTSSVTATPVWLDTVKDHGYVICNANDTLWLDFELSSGDIFDTDDNDKDDVDPYLSFARKYCYKQFCQHYCGYFGMTEVFGFLYRAFSPKYKEPLFDTYDRVYAEFIDSLLLDVRFVLCIKMADSKGPATERAAAAAASSSSAEVGCDNSGGGNEGGPNENKSNRSRAVGYRISRAESNLSFDTDDLDFDGEEGEDDFHGSHDQHEEADTIGEPVFE